MKVISPTGHARGDRGDEDKFEAEACHQLDVTVVETGAIRKRVPAARRSTSSWCRVTRTRLSRGEPITAGSALPPIRVNSVSAVRADGPRPTLTPDAPRKTFLAAKRVLITDPATGGISGVDLMEVLKKLGIVEEMKDKLVPNRGSGDHAERIVKGEADLAVQAEQRTRCVPGAVFLIYRKSCSARSSSSAAPARSPPTPPRRRPGPHLRRPARRRAGDQGQVPVAGLSFTSRQWRRARLSVPKERPRNVPTHNRSRRMARSEGGNRPLTRTRSLRQSE